MTAPQASAVHSGPTFARDVRWSFGIVGARAGASLVFVLAASRALGSATFGTLAALSALTSMSLVVTTSGVSYAATMLASRSSTGAGSILTAGARASVVAVGPVAIGYGTLVWWVLPDVPIMAAAALFVADVVVVGSAELVASVLIGLHRYRRATAVWGAVAIGRLAAGGAVAVMSPTSITVVTTAAAIAALGVVPVVAVLARSVLARPGAPQGGAAIARAGTVFATGSLVGRVNNDFDKVYLAARLGPIDSVGDYAAGYRIVEYSMLPLAALTTAAAPRMFRAGAGGVGGARSVAAHLVAVYVGTGAVLAFVLLAARGVIEAAFGDSYGGMSTVIAMLALLPLLRSVSNVLAEPLTGGGRHGRRVAILGCGLVVNVAVNVTLLASLGWRAAVWGTYASELVQLALLAGVAVVGRRPPHLRRRPLSSVGRGRQ